MSIQNLVGHHALGVDANHPAIRLKDDVAGALGQARRRWAARCAAAGAPPAASRTHVVLDCAQRSSQPAAETGCEDEPELVKADKEWTESRRAVFQDEEAASISATAEDKQGAGGTPGEARRAGYTVQGWIAAVREAEKRPERTNVVMHLFAGARRKDDVQHFLEALMLVLGLELRQRCKRRREVFTADR